MLAGVCARAAADCERLRAIDAVSWLCQPFPALALLQRVKRRRPKILTKSGLMVGLGETDDEILGVLRRLREAGVDMVTLGQYLRPSDRELPVERYPAPAEFDAPAARARAMGFLGVYAGPFVRSSYNAAEVYEHVAARR